MQAVGVREDHQQIGLQQIGDQRRQGVVVSEADLFGSDGVVLVDDGDDAELEQAREGRPGVEVALTVCQIVVGQKDHGGVTTVHGEGALICLDETHLAHGCRSLLLVNSRRPRSPAEPADTLRHGTGGNDEHLHARLQQAVDLFAPISHGSGCQSGTIVGQKGAADLDHHPPGNGQPRTHLILRQVLAHSRTYVT